MKTIKLIIICALSIAFTSTYKIPAQAQDNGRMEAAYTLIEQTKLLDNLSKASVLTATTLVEQNLKNSPNTAPYSDIFSKLLKEAINETLAEPKTQNELKQIFAAIYTEAFSEKELKDITAFYNTPTGKKCLEKLPIVLAKSQQVFQQFVENIAKSSFRQKLEYKIKQLQKEGKLPR